MYTNTLFSNPVMHQRVLNLHKSIKDTYSNLTLKEILIVGMTWNRKKIDSVDFDELKKFFSKWDYDNTPDLMLSDFRLYNQREIQNAIRRNRFIKRIESNRYHRNILESKKMTIEKLIEISLEAFQYPTLVHGIKMYLIANYDENQLMHYTGIQPQTGPVSASLKRYGLDYTQYEQTLYCNAMASREHKSSSYINSVLWLSSK